MLLYRTGSILSVSIVYSSEDRFVFQLLHSNFEEKNRNTFLQVRLTYFRRKPRNLLSTRLRLFVLCRFKTSDTDNFRKHSLQFPSLLLTYQECIKIEKTNSRAIKYTIELHKTPQMKVILLETNSRTSFRFPLNWKMLSVLTKYE